MDERRLVDHMVGEIVLKVHRGILVVKWQR